ncbi:glycosyltransferase family 4 protein [Patescibacteria group bacterium]
MTIGIDIRIFARGTRTGIEEYAINLLSHLLPLDKSINYKLFYNAFNKVDLNYPWLNLDNVKLYDFSIPNRIFFSTARYLKYPKMDKLLGCVDVYFNPHFFTAPISKKCRKVTTFHDLSFKRYPRYFSIKKRLWQLFLMNAFKEAKEADKIIAVSESTKNDLVGLYKINSDKIKVIYSGVGEQFKPLSLDDAIKVKYNLPDKFILYFGTIEPRKNIIGLIKAFELLKSKRKSELKLVLAGAMGWLYDDILKSANQSKYRKDIILTGIVDERDKPSIYNLAELFVYPSFFEGFGFPPLEAMACGIPTIVSNNSSLPEVVGDAALMVDSDNIGEMAWLMNEILSDNILKEKLRQKGLVRAKEFSWDKCSRETLRILCE